MLRAGGLRYQEKQVVVDARTNRIRLLDSGAVRRRGPKSLGACLAAEPCPCGQGAQTRFHAVFTCALPCLEKRREGLLEALRGVPQEEKGHLQLQATIAALRGRGAGLQSDGAQAKWCLQCALGIAEPGRPAYL